LTRVPQKEGERRWRDRRRAEIGPPPTGPSRSPRGQGNLAELLAACLEPLFRNCQKAAVAAVQRKSAARADAAYRQTSARRGQFPEPDRRSTVTWAAGYQATDLPAQHYRPGTPMGKLGRSAPACAASSAPLGDRRRGARTRSMT